MRAPLLACRACADRKRAREAGRPSQQGARSGRLGIVGSGQSREYGVGQEADRRALEAVALVALTARAERTKFSRGNLASDRLDREQYLSYSVAGHTQP
jgi:hypothetical protein